MWQSKKSLVHKDCAWNSLPWNKILSSFNPHYLGENQKIQKTILGHAFQWPALCITNFSQKLYSLWDHHAMAICALNQVDSIRDSQSGCFSTASNHNLIHFKVEVDR
jgi:hypothetical protein